MYRLFQNHVRTEWGGEKRKGTEGTEREKERKRERGSRERSRKVEKGRERDGGGEREVEKGRERERQRERDTHTQTHLHTHTHVHGCTRVFSCTCGAFTSVNAMTRRFVDAQDGGTILLTPSYLLLGMAIPVWLQSRGDMGACPLSCFAGILSVGVGDSAAALFGRA